MVPVLNPLKKPPSFGARVFVPNVHKPAGGPSAASAPSEAAGGDPSVHALSHIADRAGASAPSAPLGGAASQPLSSSSSMPPPSSSAAVKEKAREPAAFSTIVPFQSGPAAHSAPQLAAKTANPAKFQVKTPLFAPDTTALIMATQRPSPAPSSSGAVEQRDIRAKHSAPLSPASSDSEDEDVVSVAPKAARPSVSSSGASAAAPSVRKRRLISSADPSRPKPKRKSRSKAAASVFPPSYGAVEVFQRITLYARKTPSGVEGLVFENVENRAVLLELERGYANPQALRKGDVVVSVNYLDARYAKFEQVLAAMEGGGGSSGADGRAEGEAAAAVALRNKVSDDIVCIVFARAAHTGTPFAPVSKGFSLLLRKGATTAVVAQTC